MARPRAAPTTATLAPPLGPVGGSDWELRAEVNGAQYYMNMLTGDSTYDMPAELASTRQKLRVLATVSTYSVNDAYSMNDLRDGLDGQLRTVRVHAPTRAAGAGLAAPSCCERIAVAEGAADVFLSDDLNSCPSRDD